MSVQHNIDEAIGSFNEIVQNLDADIGKILKKTAQHIFDETEQGADRHTVTGALANAVFMRSIGGGYEIGIDIQSAPHAQFVHFKTRPHIIKPKNKKALRWAIGGDFRFSKEGVMHPGYKGDPFFQDAIDSGMRFLDQQAQQLKLRG